MTNDASGAGTVSTTGAAGEVALGTADLADQFGDAFAGPGATVAVSTTGAPAAASSWR